MKVRRIHLLLLLLVLALVALPFRGAIRQRMAPLAAKLRGRVSVEERLEQYGAGARLRLAPDFAAAGIDYPPQEVVFVGLKKERVLEVWARQDRPARMVLVRTYPILGLSGSAGPKLREGDMQVPEGVYRVESLNPNSSFHLSLRLNYPNAIDVEHARDDGRESPGTDIMIHGRSSSAGCLAMGDRAIEELFVLAADVGVERFRVILAPEDLRRGEAVVSRSLPLWTNGLYAEIRASLLALGSGAPSGPRRQ